MRKIIVSVRDPQLFLLLRHFLAQEGFDAVLAPCASDLAALREVEPAALLIDGSSADGEGIRVISEACPMFPTAAVIVLCRGTSQFQVAGIDLLLQHPFDPSRLVDFLRQIGVTHGRAGGNAGDVQFLSFADLTMDLSAMIVRREGCEVHLSALQFRILRYLLADPTAVRDRDALIAACWPLDAEVEPRTVDIHVGHIRRALLSRGPDLIRTVRGRGYALQRPNGEDGFGND